MARARARKPTAEVRAAAEAKEAKAAKAAAAKAAKPRAPRKKKAAPDVPRSIRTVVYTVDDLPRAKEFYSMTLGREPYFDQPFYVGFDVDGFELGLDPDVSRRQPGPGGSVAYWRVDDIMLTWLRLTTSGGEPLEPPHSVGGKIETAIIADPFGNLVGLIQIDD